MKLYENTYISIHGSKLLWYFCLAKSPFSPKHNGVFHPFPQDCVRQGMKGGKKQQKPGSNSTGRYAIEDMLFAFLWEIRMEANYLYWGGVVGWTWCQDDAELLAR